MTTAPTMPELAETARRSHCVQRRLSPAPCSASDASDADVVKYMKHMLPENDWSTMSEANRNHWRDSYQAALDFSQDK